MKTTTENNKIIAEFMGNDTNEYGNEVYVPKNLMFNNKDKCMQGIFSFNECEFHSDWNWLMEVVEKIESLGFKVNIFGLNADLKSHYIVIYNSENGTISVVNEQGLTKIQAVYNTCVEFIKWYNLQIK